MCPFLTVFLNLIWYNNDMKTSNIKKSKTQKLFSLKGLNKSTLKSRSFETMRTSFAIEGIKFTKSQFESLKSRGHFKK